MSEAEDYLSSEKARVYLGRDIDDIPDHPGGEWTRFVCISDTHSRKFPIPMGDVLLHSGDISAGNFKDVQRMFLWLKDLPHENKV